MKPELKELENQIRDIFDENYDFIKAEGGHSITDFIREEAFTQVLYYFRKNHDIIEKITEAEVRLTLPEQRTPNKKLKYTIEGIIDIVREGDETWMYDLKTHDRFSIENHKELYRQQLNVYAFIWKTLRGNDLDNTAVISTSLPNQLKTAIKNGNDEYIVHEMDAWDPVVPLGYSESEIESMIEEFGRTVEEIEDNRFNAPPVEKLFEKEEGERNIFAHKVCRNCDARFSCESFREYVRQSDRGGQGLRKYLDDYGTEFSTDDFIDGNINIENK